MIRTRSTMHVPAVARRVRLAGTPSGPLFGAPACALACALIGTASGPAPAADAWYVGAGAGVSLLAPDTGRDGPDVDDGRGTAATVFLGRDLDARTSVQVQAHALGEAVLDDGGEVDYRSVDGSLLHRFAGAVERSRGERGVALYGRVGIGVMDRDTDAPLDADAAVRFGLGAGLEIVLNPTLSLRTEALYYDTDAGAAFASVVARFGSRTGEDPPTGVPPPDPPVPIAPAAPRPERMSLPETGTADTRVADADGDAIADADDACPASSPGYPVRADGCALFDGVLSGVRFENGGGELAAGASGQLDELARLLERFPASRIRLHAHSDARGSERDQSIITRARLRTIGLHLVERGIAADRLVLRSFGGRQPLGGDPVRDNRIEVLEHLP